MVDENNYSVYKHTNKINGKVYIGITGRKPEKRWSNGNGYRENCHFWNAIKKYGWDNFAHEIIKDNLTKDEAEKLEISLISKYDSTNQKNGYNQNLGGNSIGQHSKETRRKISEIQYKTVFQYDRYTGEFLHKYQSTLEAEKKLSIPNSDISSVCLKKVKTSHNFVFRYEEDGYIYDNPLSNEELKLINSNKSTTKVGKYDLNGNLLVIYDMVKLALLDPDAPSKSKIYSILDSNESVNGFFWKRINDSYADDFLKLYSQVKNKPQKVVQYSSETYKIIKIYDSIEDAEAQTGVKARYIRQSCNNKRITSGGFIWRFYSKGNNELKMEDCYDNRKNNSKPVNQLSLNKEFIKKFDSITDAARELNISPSSISRCLGGLSKTSKGFLWEYAS